MVGGRRTVWVPHFAGVDGKLQVRTPGAYDGKERIQTPYDGEARWSETRGKGWIGYQLHVSETDAAALPHLLPDSAVPASSADDRAALAPIAERQDQRDGLPNQRCADQGDVCGPTRTAADQRGEDLVGPAPKESSPQVRMPDGLTHADVQIDLEQVWHHAPTGRPPQRNAFTARRRAATRESHFAFPSRGVPTARCARAVVPAKAGVAWWCGAMTCACKPRANRRQRSRRPPSSTGRELRDGCRRWCVGRASDGVATPDRRRTTCGRGSRAWR